MRSRGLLVKKNKKPPSREREGGFALTPYCGIRSVEQFVWLQVMIGD
jgi:hypothetical protein